MGDLAEIALLENRWNDAHAATLDEPGRLLYRSHLLGADKRLTNFGGGNTSAKVMQPDPLRGEPAEVLWVKGSGGDVGTMKLDGFATLYMEKLRHLKTSIAVRNTKMRWWAICPTARSISTRARLRSTRRCTPSFPSPMWITCIRTP